MGIFWFSQRIGVKKVPAENFCDNLDSCYNIRVQ